jgi:pSer/pThr/pTyr-binding forkhead associated (FHA) protein
VDLGGMTLQLTKESAKRNVQDFNRIRGTVILSRANGPDLERFVAENFQVGKDPSCDLVIKGWFAPRKALLIVRGFGSYTLINVSPSPKGVLVNGQPVIDRITLRDGVSIEAYGAKFRFGVTSDKTD